MHGNWIKRLGITIWLITLHWIAKLWVFVVSPFFTLNYIKNYNDNCKCGNVPYINTKNAFLKKELLFCFLIVVDIEMGIDWVILLHLISEVILLGCYMQ